jgi:hypothetical protein
VPFVSDDEVDDNDLTVAEDDDQSEDADTVIWSEVEQNLNVEEFRERTGPQDTTKRKMKKRNEVGRHIIDHLQEESICKLFSHRGL